MNQLIRSVEESQVAQPRTKQYTLDKGITFIQDGNRYYITLSFGAILLVTTPW